MKHVSLHGNDRDGYSVMLYKLVPVHPPKEGETVHEDALTTRQDWAVPKYFDTLDEAMSALSYFAEED